MESKSQEREIECPKTTDLDSLSLDATGGEEESLVKMTTTIVEEEEESEISKIEETLTIDTAEAGKTRPPRQPHSREEKVREKAEELQGRKFNSSNSSDDTLTVKYLPLDVEPLEVVEARETSVRLGDIIKTSMAVSVLLSFS